MNDKILFSLTKLIKFPDTPTNTKQVNDKVKGVILEIFYIKIMINLTILLGFWKIFLAWFSIKLYRK